MSSGATLRHTDDLAQFRTFAAGRTMFGHATPTPDNGPCVAHEWMNAWQTLHTASVRAPRSFAPLASLRQTPTLALHLSGFDYVSGRAPPSLVS